MAFGSGKVENEKFLKVFIGGAIKSAA